MESIYEYGARAGFWRLHRLFTGLGIPATVYGVATALARSPEQVAAMQDAGWEIASHGLKWIEYRDMPEAEERAHLAEAIRLHAEVTGERPRGWYLGRCSMNTVRLVAEEGGFDYVSDSYADDLPYWITRWATGDQLIIPYTLDANDMRFATPQGFNAGDQFEAYLKRQLRRALRRRRADDVRGPPLPPDRPPGPDHGAANASWNTRPATRASGSRAASTSPATGRRSTQPGPAPAHPKWTAPPSSRLTAASSSTRPGSPRAPGRSNSAPPTTPPAGLHNALTRIFRAAPRGPPPCASSPPTPTSRASSRRRAGSPKPRPPSRPPPGSTR